LKPTDNATTGIGRCDRDHPAKRFGDRRKYEAGLKTATYACSLGIAFTVVDRTCQPDGNGRVRADLFVWSTAARSALRPAARSARPSQPMVQLPTTRCANWVWPSGSVPAHCQMRTAFLSRHSAKLRASRLSLVAGANRGNGPAPTLTVVHGDLFCGTAIRMHGTATAPCQADRTWAGTAPTCTIIDCGPPPALQWRRQLPHHDLWFTAPILPATGFICRQCDRTCQADISVGHAPTCVLVDCVRPWLRPTARSALHYDLWFHGNLFLHHHGLPFVAACNPHLPGRPAAGAPRPLAFWSIGGAPLAPTTASVSARLRPMVPRNLFLHHHGHHLSGSATRTLPSDTALGPAHLSFGRFAAASVPPANGTVDVPGTT